MPNLFPSWLLALNTCYKIVFLFVYQVMYTLFPLSATLAHITGKNWEKKIKKDYTGVYIIICCSVEGFGKTSESYDINESANGLKGEWTPSV